MPRVLASILALLTGCAGTMAEQIHDTSTELLAASLTSEQRTLTEADLSALPVPVQRHLRHIGAVGVPLPRNVRMEQVGRIRKSADAKWMDFHSWQYFSALPTDFVWYARVDGSSVQVVDQYVAGQGLLEVKLGSLITLGTEEGPEADQGEGMRWLSELFFLPGALASEVMEWKALDDSSARATLAGTDITGVFFFDDSGEVLRFEGERCHEEGDKLPWSGTVDTWTEAGGFRVPREVHATWHHPEGDDDYVSIQVLSYDFDATEPFEV